MFSLVIAKQNFATVFLFSVVFSQDLVFSFAGGDNQVGFVGQTGKPPGPGPSMMSGAPTGSQSQQQMVYAVQPQNQVMSQQAQHNQPSGGQFGGAPQGVQNYTRFNSQVTTK